MTDRPRPTTTRSREDAAARLTTYVHGNPIVLAALAVLDLRHAGSWSSIAPLTPAGPTT